jgi:alkylation response protein AidB-like acyl-CoA dehydrogenase
MTAIPSTRPPEPSAADLERFRDEVRAWLPGQIDGVGATTDAADLTLEQFQRNRVFLRALGQKGWYAPGWPKEYGGGGLSRPFARVLRQELERAIPHLENCYPLGDIGGALAGAVWLLGTEEQKQRLIPPILRGTTVTWELYTEPESGSDLPSLKTTAVRQGDTYVINGTKTLVGGHWEYDQFFCLARTDPDGERAKNLSVFVVPSGVGGVTITDLDMIAGSRKRTIVLEDVVVPAANRVGREGDGWAAFNSMFAGARFGQVGLGPNQDRDLDVFAMLLAYARTERSAGQRLIEKHGPREAMTKAWMEAQIQRLLRQRNERLIASGGSFTYEGAQVALERKLWDLKLSEAIQHTLGPLANIKDVAWAPEDAEFEYFQRYAILNVHPGGTVEVQKLRMFRGCVAARPGLETKGRERA